MGNKIQRIYIGTDLVRPKWKPGANTIAYWELNGNGNDTKNDYGVTTYTTTNYNSTGYIGAGNPTYTTSRNGKACAYFDGTRAIQLPGLPIPSNKLTFSAWVKLASNPSQAAYFFQLREDTSTAYSSSFFFSALNGKIYPICVTTTTSSGSTGAAAYQTDGITSSLDTRYNIVATFNAGVLKFYVNGNLKNSVTGGAYLRNINSEPSYIGAKKHSRYPELVYLNGYIQDIIYENKVWTGQDVVDYYNLTK